MKTFNGRIMLAGFLLGNLAIASDHNPPASTFPVLASSAMSAAPVRVAGDAEQRAEALLKQMTLEEKIDYLGGDRGVFIRAIPRLNIPEIKLADGPMGCRKGPSPAYGAGIGLAAAWDTNLAFRMGASMGRDCRQRGVHVLLAPGMNINRSPLCGRNFEYMGEDPLLAGRTASGLIQGLRSEGVLATVKHFAVNNQEWDRSGISSEVDERTLREIYLPAFKAAVQEGHVACVMSAYNLLNGVYCSHNDWLLNQVLKKEWGFDGVVMSDWGAVHDAKGATLGGCDLEMPGANFMNRSRLLPLVKDGSVSQAVIDDKVRRILRTIIDAGFLDRPQLRRDIPADDPASDAVALEGARASIVLLKNSKGVLPLDSAKVESILVVGPNAHPAVICGSGSGYLGGLHPVSILDGIKALAPGAKVVHHCGLQSSPGSDSLPTGRYAGADELTALAKSADVVVACVGFSQATDANSAGRAYKAFWPDGWARKLGLVEAEDHDRPFALPDAQVATLRTVAAANKRVVVVLNAGAGVDPAGWLDQVPTLLSAWYPGQAGGTAVAEILFGAVNPSGKLPVTFARRFEDYPCAPFYNLKAQKKTPYSEGVNVGYRGFDAADVEPLFCFGHGLSYTTFRYADMHIQPAADGTVAVSFTVQNTGQRDGAEVAQVYVTPAVGGDVPRPPRELKGFARVALKAGERHAVTVVLDRSAFSYWHPGKKAWTIDAGSHGIVVGASSRDIRLKGAFTPRPEALERQTIWSSGEEGYHTYRIPSLIVTAKGTVLAFCEGRRKSGGDSGDIDLVLKRSTDGGKTWGRQQVVWDDGENTCGNPCPVIDESTGTIWLLMTHNLGTDPESAIIKKTSKGARTVWVCRSEDDGVTWSKPVEITASVKNPDWTWFATGPGVGIQMRGGKHAGRLIVPCDAMADKPYSLAIFSDDHGLTWKKGGLSPGGFNECQAVELAEGRLMLNMRNHATAIARGVCFSDDGGETWKDCTQDAALPEPQCQASILRYNWSEPSKPGRILFSNPAGNTRANMTVRMSEDDGKTWLASRRIADGPAAYSCLARLGDGRVGLLYETGERLYTRIDLVSFDPGRLIENYNEPFSLQRSCETRK